MKEAETTRADTTRGGVPVAHSIVEERLFLLTVRCPCGAGPLSQTRQSLTRVLGRIVDVVHARCPRCRREHRFDFDATSFFGRFYPRRGVSDRREPSELLDRVAWVRWARLYLRAFNEGTPGPGRAMAPGERIDCGVLALRCLDEALKFLDAGHAPGDEAPLHSHGSLEAFRKAPERFGRVEVLGLKLQAAMLLAGAGVDPDAAEPGKAVASGLVVAAVGRLSARPAGHEMLAPGDPPASPALPPAREQTTSRPERPRDRILPTPRQFIGIIAIALSIAALVLALFYALR